MQWLMGRKKAFVFTYETAEGPGDAPLRSVSGGLPLGWPGPRADGEKWQHLAPL